MKSERVFILVVKKINQEICLKCLKCYNFCPMDVFGVDDNMVFIKYKDDCQSCYLCVIECPSNAILVDPERPVDIFDVYKEDIL